MSARRIVLDTNVLLSRILWPPSVPERAVVRAIDTGTILTSDTAERIELTAHVAACRDPQDDHVLALVVSGRADLIVTGDADLLVLDPFRGIPILTPKAFLDGAGG